MTLLFLYTKKHAQKDSGHNTLDMCRKIPSKIIINKKITLSMARGD